MTPQQKYEVRLAEHQKVIEECYHFLVETDSLRQQVSDHQARAALLDRKMARARADLSDLETP